MFLALCCLSEATLQRRTQLQKEVCLFLWSISSFNISDCLRTRYAKQRNPGTGMIDKKSVHFLWRAQTYQMDWIRDNNVWFEARRRHTDMPLSHLYEIRWPVKKHFIARRRFSRQTMDYLR